MTEAARHMMTRTYLDPDRADFYRALAELADRKCGPIYETPERCSLAGVLGRIEAPERSFEAELFRIAFRVLIREYSEASLDREFIELASEYITNDNHIAPAKMTRLLQMVDDYGARK